MSSRLVINPPVIAHRGANKYAPENSLAAIRKVKEIGVNWVEFDVMLTSDKEVVVIHDETLDRTTNGKGLVLLSSYSHIKTLDAGSWFNPTFHEERIPTLIQVIELLNELHLCANIEIKSQAGNEAETVRIVLQIISNHWKNPTPLLISSFSIPILQEVRKQSPESEIGFLMHEWNSDWKKFCESLRASSINVNEEILDLEKINLLKATKLPLLSYTVNSRERAKELFSLGVDAVFSDDPKSILKDL